MSDSAAIPSRSRDRAASRRSAGQDRWLALVFPWLAADRLRATRPHLFVPGHAAPVAFRVAGDKAGRLAAVDRAAAALGLAPGMTQAEAQARVPELAVFAQEPHADLDWLERLAEGCARYTPVVAPMPPDALLLEIGGRAAAFGDERGLSADVERRLARQGVLVRHAFGDTPAVAQALARHAGAPAPDERGAVRRLPVTALGIDPEDAAAAGLKTVGEVMAQPLAGIVARFGGDVGDAVRELAGELRGSVRPHAPVAPIRTERRLTEPVMGGAAVLAVIDGLVADAAATLARGHQGARRWQVWLFRSDAGVDRLCVEATLPTRDAGLVGRLVRGRMAALRDPGTGYDLIRVEVALAERLDADQLRLEGGGARERDGHGVRRVRRAGQRDGAEQAELMLAVAAPGPIRQAASVALSRPIHLFDPPEPVDRVMEGPDGPPARFRWRRRMHEVAQAEGPERIAGEGGRRPDAPACRDYFRIEDRRGRRLWVFRSTPDGGAGAARWFVHGVFA